MELACRPRYSKIPLNIQNHSILNSKAPFRTGILIRWRTARPKETPLCANNLHVQGSTTSACRQGDYMENVFATGTVR